MRKHATQSNEGARKGAERFALAVPIAGALQRSALELSSVLPSTMAGDLRRPGWFETSVPDSGLDRNCRLSLGEVIAQFAQAVRGLRAVVAAFNGAKHLREERAASPRQYAAPGVGR